MGDFGFVEMLLLCVLLAAALGAHVPQGEERRAILEAARKPLVEDIGQPIKFVLSTFLVQNGWAFYQGHPISASGSKINWLETKYKSDVEEGFLDENIQGLLRREGGRWVSKAHAVGCPALFAWTLPRARPLGLLLLLVVPRVPPLAALACTLPKAPSVARLSRLRAFPSPRSSTSRRSSSSTTSRSPRAAPAPRGPTTRASC